MRKQIMNVLEHRLFHALVGALLFMGVASLFINTYYQYLDNRQYYRLELPVSVDKDEYYACNEVVLSGKVYSEVAARGTSQRELVLVRVDTEETVQSVEKTVNLNTTPEDGVFFKRRVNLPCDLETGSYFYRGRLDYEVRDVGKHFEFYTETFEVIK
jgi:hypothetical protein